MTLKSDIVSHCKNKANKNLLLIQFKAINRQNKLEY